MFSQIRKITFKSLGRKKAKVVITLHLRGKIIDDFFSAFWGLSVFSKFSISNVYYFNKEKC